MTHTTMVTAQEKQSVNDASRNEQAVAEQAVVEQAVVEQVFLPVEQAVAEQPDGQENLLAVTDLAAVTDPAVAFAILSDMVTGTRAINGTFLERWRDEIDTTLYLIHANLFPNPFSIDYYLDINHFRVQIDALLNRA